MKNRRALRRLSLLLLALAALPTHAGGPLYVGGPAFGIDGVPFRWSGTVDYWTDQGQLGTLSTTEADNLVREAFAEWENVTTATVSFSRQGQLTADVNAANILAFLNAQQDCTPSGQPTNAIIYDANGSALQALGEDPETVLGTAGAVCLGSDGTFTRGYALLNGKDITSSTTLRLKAVMIHEFGHLIGLDHSQINLNCLPGLGTCGAEDLMGLPTMFPVLVDPIEQSTLSADDIAAVSALYPDPTFASSTGRITGQILFSLGLTPAQGFNVIARQVGNPRAVAVSSVSGYLFTADAGNPLVVVPGITPSPYGSRNQSLLGLYDIPGLPPGTYTVEVEAISTADPIPFVAGSGLGPFGQLGFQFPLPSLLPQPPACSVEYLVSGSTASCDSGTATPLTIAAGEIRSVGTDVILIDTPPRYDAWEDEP